MDKISKKLEDVCRDLNLDYTPDWGIINADGSRLNEFLDYISNHKALLPFSMEYEFLELIIASMNKAILKGLINNDLQKRFYTYIEPKLYDNRFYPHIPYWVSIKSTERYPVGLLLQSYMTNKL